jgi:chaperonin GroES
MRNRESDGVEVVETPPEEKTMTFEQHIANCFIEPKVGKIVIMEDAFTYSGRLVIPENAKRRPTTGRVMKIGEGVTGVKVGERVVYTQFGGTLIEFRNAPAYRILSPDEVLGEITKSDAELADMRI